MTRGATPTRDIVGMPEIAERAGVLRGTISVWRVRYKDFPAPVRQLKTGPLFDWRQVREWLDETGRLPPEAP